MRQIFSPFETWPGSLPSALGSVFFVTHTRTLQNISQSVISFMTGVFINVSVRLGPTVFTGPGLAPSLRVIDREAIKQGMSVHSGEALNDAEIRRGSTEPGLVGKVGCLDDKRVAF